MATVTNTTAAPALSGQGVKVTLSGAEADTYLSTIVAGQVCSTSTPARTGTVLEVDYPGLSFLVRPVSDANRFDTAATPGVLAASETVTVTI